METWKPWAVKSMSSTLTVEGFQKTKMHAVLVVATLDKNLKFLNWSLCMKETTEEANFVSTKPQTSNLFFFMRLTTSCCLRGLLSPLTFQ